MFELNQKEPLPSGGGFLFSERGHPVRLSAQREQPLSKAIQRGKSERALPAGGQDVRAPLKLEVETHAQTNLTRAHGAGGDQERIEDGLFRIG